MFESEPTRLPFLYGLAASRDSETRRLVLRIAIDQFMARAEHVPAAVRRFENDIASLLAESDATSRLGAARKLCAHATPPTRILDQIADLGGEAEIVVLTQARSLSRQRLEAAASGEMPKALAVARRNDLDAQLVAILVERNERAVAMALALNPSAPLDADILMRWTPTAVRDPELAQALLARAAPSLDQAPLFFVATPDQRLALLAAAQRAELAQPRSVSGPAGAREAVTMLEGLALSDQEEMFVSALSLGLRCPEELASKIAGEPSGEALVVALAALEISREVAVRILLSGDLRSGANLKRISALIRLKDALSPAAARRLIAAMSGARSTPRARYAPQLDPTAAPTPSRAAAPAAPTKSRQNATTIAAKSA